MRLPNAAKTAGYAMAGYLLLSGAGCVFDDLNLSELDCPCGPGMVCDMPTLKCIKLEASPDAGGDAARDVRSDIVFTDSALPDIGRDVGAGDVAAGDVAADPRSDPEADAPLDMSVVDVPIDVLADVPPDVPPPRPVCDVHASAFLCEDFESGLGAWVPGGEPTVVDTSRFFGGNSSLLAQTRASTSATLFRMLGTTVSSGDLYIRVRFFVPSARDRDPSFLSVLEAGGSPAGVTFSVRGRQVEAYFPEPRVNLLSTTRFVPDAWNCLQVHIAVSDTSGSLTYSINGGAATSRSGFDTRPPSNYTGTNIGITYLPSAGASAINLDELVFDRTPLPCE